LILVVWLHLLLLWADRCSEWFVRVP